MCLYFFDCCLRRKKFEIVLLYIIDIESGSKVFKKISWVVFMWNYLFIIYLIIFVYYVFSEGYYMYE